ncbi:MAG: hypothetical protein WA825_17275 [Steroidobacteraceae bacterium]
MKNSLAVLMSLGCLALGAGAAIAARSSGAGSAAEAFVNVPSR